MYENISVILINYMNNVVQKVSKWLKSLQFLRIYV